MRSAIDLLGDDHRANLGRDAAPTRVASIKRANAGRQIAHQQLQEGRSQQG
jgi:hypothetical protein